MLSRVTLTNSFVPSTSSSSIVAVATQHPFSSLALRTNTNTDIRLQMSSSATSLAMDTIQGAQSMIDAIIDEKNCNPVLVRLAWHEGIGQCDCFVGTSQGGVSGHVVFGYLSNGFGTSN
jgi:hypothetical protein